MSIKLPLRTEAIHISCVSVIVPIYNTKRFLNRCLDSITAQTLKDIEIILVDDGSTDGSDAVADSYAIADKRIKVVHRANGGLSSARNAGLEVANGEYVGFVDSDDYIAHQMFEKLYNAAKVNDADVVMSRFFRVLESGEIFDRPLMLQKEVYEGSNVIDHVLIPMIGADSHAEDDISVDKCVTKNIYKRSIIVDNKITFISDKELMSEDIFFNLDYLRYAKCVSVVDEPLYYYIVNPQSLSQVYNPNRFEDACIFFECLKERLMLYGIYGRAKERLYRTFIGIARTCIISQSRDNKEDSALKRISNIKKILNNQLLINVLKDYPIEHYPPKLRFVTICMKRRLASVLFAVTLNHKRH